MAMKSVTGSAKAKRGKLRAIRVEGSANKGFMVHRERHPPEGGFGYNPPEAPDTFGSQAAAHKHIKALMPALHGEPEPTSEDMSGEGPEQQQS